MPDGLLVYLCKKFLASNEPTSDNTSRRLDNSIELQGSHLDSDFKWNGNFFIADLNILISILTLAEC